MADNKYKIFRNFMVNELQITRDDLIVWTKEAISEIVPKFIQQINITNIINRKITDIFNSIEFRNDVKKMIAEILSNNFEIEIKKKVKNNNE